MPPEMLQVLDPDGTLQKPAPLEIPDARRLYRAMVASRLYDRKCSALQRQGRLATYAPLEGQEAAQIGSAAALDPADWMVATYRDAAAMWFHGYPWAHLILGRTGDERGGSPPDDVPVLPPSITVGAHMLHAVGLAWASLIKGDDRVAITYFGDGATSEGDFHEAMNFAGVFGTPTVFFCENNQYAISLPRAQQTASETIAQKAAAYGMAGTLVDGNDLFAVYEATSEAVGRARDGGGPALVEALTYRVGPHTTTDDPDRYRDEAEVTQWRRRDPLERVRRYLEHASAWDGSWQSEIEIEESAVIEDSVTTAEETAPLGPGDVFGGMFAELTAPLEEQRSFLEGDDDGSEHG